MRTFLAFLLASLFLASAQQPVTTEGIWLGTLHAGPQTLRVQVTLKSDASGHQSCTLDSIDQSAFGIPCTNAVLAHDDFSFDVPAVKGAWKGKLSADGKTLSGTWTQMGNPLPLEFTRQTTAISGTPLSYDPVLPPVDAADLQAALDRDLAKAIASGSLAPATGTGISIAVVQHGVRRIFAYGTAKPDSIFEIGSVTKTFTGLILAQMVVQGKVKYDEPVRALLPPGTVAKPAGPEITLLDLATQHSGLPRMPDNFHPADPANPYADYGKASLYAFIAKQGVAKPDVPPYGYSNLGFGLLGQALSERAGMPYPALLKKEVTGPLGLKDTVVAFSPEQQRRFIAGHDADHHPAHAWDLDALAGAGAIRSTAADMLTYLEAQLHPDKVKAGTLSDALMQSHELRNEVGPGMRIALAWMCNTETGAYWHNGATGGYSSFAVFNPKDDFAAVVLVNVTIGAKGSLADALGSHVTARLTGKPALSVD